MHTRQVKVWSEKEMNQYGGQLAPTLLKVQPQLLPTFDGEQLAKPFPISATSQVRHPIIIFVYFFCSSDDVQLGSAFFGNSAVNLTTWAISRNSYPLFWTLSHRDSFYNLRSTSLACISGSLRSICLDFEFRCLWEDLGRHGRCSTTTRPRSLPQTQTLAYYTAGVVGEAGCLRRICHHHSYRFLGNLNRWGRVPTYVPTLGERDQRGRYIERNMSKSLI